MSVSHPAQISSAPPVPSAEPRPVPSHGPRSWLRRIATGGQIVETCPAWCADGHENDGHGMLDDLVHGSERVAMNLSLHVASTDGPAVWPVLSARVEVHPYSDRPEWGVPHVLLEASPDDVVESMSPEEFAAFIAAGRAHLDRLEAEVLGLVKAAVADHKGQAA